MRSLLLYYTRAVASRRIQCVRACLVAMALASTPLSARQLPAGLTAGAGPSDLAATYLTTRDRFEAANRPPIELTIVSKSDAADRAPAIAETSKRALAMLDAWLGPLATGQLTIVDVPWNSRLANGSYRGVVVVRSRWIAQERDRALEREIIAGLTGQYWIERSGAAPDAFVDGLSIYTAGRAIDMLLQGSQFYADRFLGGFLPYALRPVSLSPPVRDMRPRLRRYPELETGTPGAERAARALEVAERYLGWPAVQQALEVFRQGPSLTLPSFLAIASAQRGSDVAPLFRGILQENASIDYALSSLESRPVAGGFDVRITIDRRGDAVFARPLPIETRFADGTVRRDSWDGGQAQATLRYDSSVDAVSAAIDPEVILIVDEVRSNNVIRHQPQPLNRLALRLACNWVIWLQNVVVTYSGIV
jgi:hypothetical protein